MTPNNNLSVLPWYDSLDRQNARKWWVYGRIFPLYSRAGFLLPFQIMRNRLYKYEPTDPIQVETYDSGVLFPDGSWVENVGNDYGVSEYDVGGMPYIYFENLPRNTYPLTVAAVAFDSNNNVVGTFTPNFDENDLYNGGWALPDGAGRILVQTYIADNPESCTVYDTTRAIAPVKSFKLYTKDGALVGDYTNPVANQITIKSVGDLDVLVYPGTLPFTQSLANGQYYAVLEDMENTWYSEIFTNVNDISGYMKLEWWDDQDFMMDAGVIVYTGPAFHNILYLPSSIAKPEYPFEEEGETRDGYFFPIKQVSIKRYRFAFLAPEYLLDVMRFIRMADHLEITKNGQTYTADTFLMTPEWEDNGDVATVEVEFDTNTVAKKIGAINVQGVKAGDFNDDFNDDFLIS